MLFFLSFFLLFPFALTQSTSSLSLDLVPSAFHHSKNSIRTLQPRNDSVVFGSLPFSGNGSIDNGGSGAPASLSSDPSKEFGLKNYYNTEYLVRLFLGSEEESIPVLVDTGSSLLWMFSSRIPTASKIKYDCGRSISCQVINQKEQLLKYGRMKFLAIETRNRLSFGTGTNDFSIMDQQVFLVTSEAYDQMSSSGGMMGLSLENVSENFVYKLFQLKKIPNTQFALYLSYDYGMINFEKSKMVIGGYDESHLLYGKKTRLDTFSLVPNSTQWEVRIRNLKFIAKEDGKIVDLAQKNAQKGKNDFEKVDSAIIDSGTSLILIPPNQFLSLVDNLKENYDLACSQDSRLLLYKCDCNKISKRFNLPLLEFEFFDESTQRNQSYSIGGEDILDSWCFLNIYFQDVHNSSWVLGDIFLRKYYVIHDMSSRTVTIGEAKRPIHKSREWLLFLVVIVMALGFLTALAFGLLLIFKRNVNYQSLSVFRSININPFRRIEVGQEDENEEEMGDGIESQHEMTVQVGRDQAEENQNENSQSNI